MDRQDIDALLIGALYGELTPADEARLSAHLESHPTDRGALEDLKVTRQSVLDSRIFALQLEPPQAVSALLLQEAHRRAPKRAPIADSEQKEGWFYRFTRSFMAHPAMAAAAMLVLVLGGAGIVYMKKGDQFADKQVASPSGMDNSAASAPAEAVEGGAAHGSAYGAGIYEPEREHEKDDKNAETATASDRWEQAAQEKDSHAQGVAQPKAESVKQKLSPSRGIAVSTSKGGVKELPGDLAGDRERKVGKNDAVGIDGLARDTGGRAGAGAQAGAAESTYAQPPSPPPPAATSPSGSITANKGAPSTIVTAPLRAPSDAKPAPAKSAAKDQALADAPKQEARREDSTLVAWAKGEHSRAVSLAQRGECSTAAKVALGVSSRASEYYAQYMATDRALKQCAAYISAERDREAERSGKARAQKRVNAEEAAPAPTTTK